LTILGRDRNRPHRATAIRLTGHGRFAFEWLPPYAPDLNPAAVIWSHTKCADLANYVPDDVLDQELMRSFFHGSAGVEMIYIGNAKSSRLAGNGHSHQGT